MTTSPAIQRKPFTPHAILCSPGDNLVSAVALNYELPYTSAICFFQMDHLREDDPALDAAALESRAPLRRRDLSVEATDLLGRLAGTCDLSPDLRARIDRIRGGVFAASRAKAPGVHTGALAMALEEVMLAVAWPRDQAARLASLVARLTDCAIAEVKLARYTGYSADVATHLQVDPELNLGFLLRLGKIAADDPRLEVPDASYRSLEGMPFELLALDVHGSAVAIDPDLSTLTGSPYARSALRRLEKTCAASLEEGVVLRSQAGAKLMDALASLAEGCAMNLAEGGAPDDRVFDLLAKSHRILAFRRLVMEWLRDESGARAREAGDGVKPAGTPFLRACRAAAPYA